MTDSDGLIRFKESEDDGLLIIDSRGNTRVQSNALVDLVFVVDTTGSMDGEIEGLLKSLKRLAAQLDLRDIDWRIATMAFGDLTVKGDKIVVTPFTDKLEVVKKSLDDIPRYNGGGNEGESSLEALVKALELPTYRFEAIKVCLLLTDEPALKKNLTPKVVTERLVEAGILTFVISEPQGYFQEMARKTGGAWFQISAEVDFSSILDQLFRQVAQTVVAVQVEAGGDVQKYLQLNPPK
jgi:hypothetical protein